MLLVFQKVKSEDEARKAPLPQPVESGFKWPHGLTPPMHDCVNRRFAKVISRKEIEDKEAEVQRLLAADRAAQSTRWEWVGDEQHSDDEEDAEGDIDDSGYFHNDHGNGGADDDFVDEELARALEEEFDRDFLNTTASPATQREGETPASTPAITNGASKARDDSGDDDDDDDDDDDEDEVDEAELNRQNDIKSMIQELRKQLKELEGKLPLQPSPLLRKRLEEKIRSTKVELHLKISQVSGEDEEDD